MSHISELSTPCALVAEGTMLRNIQRMQDKVCDLGRELRPHIKTTKCNHITSLLVQYGATGVTVSTLKEAEEAFKCGVLDVLYAVCISPNKLRRVQSLMLEGCDIKVLTDSVEGASAIVKFGVEHHCYFNVLVEIDTDDHRAGVKPDSAALLDIALAIRDNSCETGGAELKGIMTHAGESYNLSDETSLVAFAELERSRCVHAAQRLELAGFPCPIVSVGSTPTALSYQTLDGVTEVRAGVYVFFDLVMYNIGVCSLDDIALSVLTSVIGHQPDKGWIIIDAGWMALSRDRGTQQQLKDFGYGQVCDMNGVLIEGMVVTGANQEHGIIAAPPTCDVTRDFPVGSLLRVLPNHACATAAQFSTYHIVGSSGFDVVANWDVYSGW